MTVRSKVFSVFAAALCAALTLPTPASAETRAAAATTPNPKVTRQLKDFKQTAHDMRVQANHLAAATSGRQVSWQSHVSQHRQIKEHINDMGKMLASLERQTPQANHTQRLAIENARPHLAAAAGHLTALIEMVNDGRRAISQSDYADAVRSLQSHSESLYSKLDTILDYQHAMQRLNNLEL